MLRNEKLKVHQIFEGRHIKALLMDYNPGTVLVLFAQL